MNRGLSHEMERRPDGTQFLPQEFIHVRAEKIRQSLAVLPRGYAHTPTTARHRAMARRR